MPGQVPRGHRVEVAHDAMLVLSDGSEHKVTITDVSSDGFRLHTVDTVPIGDHVFLRVPRYGDFPAQIRWALGREAGGVFLEPIELPTI
ncbi:MAG TPA: PilZ domain-containing protein [Sphingomicrobium sp.]|nr:PilZ domain-containing protein [Sphingomicrobium sp.]